MAEASRDTLLPQEGDIVWIKGVSQLALDDFLAQNKPSGVVDGTGIFVKAFARDAPVLDQALLDEVTNLRRQLDADLATVKADTTMPDKTQRRQELASAFTDHLRQTAVAHNVTGGRFLVYCDRKIADEYFSRLSRVFLAPRGALRALGVPAISYRARSGKNQVLIAIHWHGNSWSAGPVRDAWRGILMHAGISPKFYKTYANSLAKIAASDSTGVASSLYLHYELLSHEETKGLLDNHAANVQPAAQDEDERPPHRRRRA